MKALFYACRIQLAISPFGNFIIHIWSVGVASQSFSNETLRNNSSTQFVVKVDKFHGYYCFFSNDYNVVLTRECPSYCLHDLMHSLKCLNIGLICYVSAALNYLEKLFWASFKLYFEILGSNKFGFDFFSRFFCFALGKQWKCFFVKP